jgi:hypothetical protein
MSAAPEVRSIMRAAWELPHSVEARLRKMALDKMSGTVELNFKSGQICSFNVKEHIEIPRQPML